MDVDVPIPPPPPPPQQQEAGTTTETDVALRHRHAQFVAALDALVLPLSGTPETGNHPDTDAMVHQLARQLDWSVEDTAAHAYAYFVALQQMDDAEYTVRYTQERKRHAQQQTALRKYGLSPGRSWTADEIRLLHTLLVSFQGTPNIMARIATFFPKYSKEQVERQVYALQQAKLSTRTTPAQPQDFTPPP